MSDESSGPRPDDPQAAPSGAPGQESPVEPTQPYSWSHPLTAPMPPVPPPDQPAQYQSPYQSPYQLSDQSQADFQSGFRAGQGVSGRRSLPGWTWPVICAVCLLLGLGGGALGGFLVAHDNDAPSGSGGVLEVQRRTAPPLPADNDSVAAVAAKVLPSTVQIIAEYDGKDRGATGSGFVFDTKGHVITNNHVVAEAAGDDGPIEVIDRSGKRHHAKVVGRSSVYDIAVLDVEGADELEPAAIGSSDQMRVGETVVAFGSPLGLSATVTSGIISALNRPVTTGDGDDSSFINAVQTDAAINPGNSGGPLVNLQGQVIGVNSAIASLGSVSTDEGGNIGVGFAIPIEQVQVTTDQILRTGKAEYPVIGATVRGTEEGDGAKVQEINSGTPAAKSDLEVGDLIIAVDGKPVTGSIDLVVAIRTHQPGQSVTLTVRRDGKERDIVVGLAAKTG